MKPIVAAIILAMIKEAPEAILAGAEIINNNIPEEDMSQYLINKDPEDYFKKEGE